jgi:hypothetical protein
MNKKYTKYMAVVIVGLLVFSMLASSISFMLF